VIQKYKKRKADTVSSE